MTSGVCRTKADVLTVRLLIRRGTQSLVLERHVRQLVHVHVAADRVRRRPRRRTTYKIRTRLVTTL